MTGASANQLDAGQSDRWATLSLAAKAALALSGTFIAVGLFTIGAALPPLQTSFAGTPNATLLIQLIGSIAAPAFALASPVTGRLVGRYGIRNVYLVALALFLAAGIAPMLCDSLAVILALRVLLGFAVAGAFTAGMVGIARMPETQRHMMYGLSAFLAGGIAIVAYQLVGSLAAQGWRWSFLVHLLLLPALIVALFLPGDQGRAGAGGNGGGGQGRLAGVPPAVLLASVFIGWGMVANSIYSPFYLAAMGVTDPGKVGSVLAIMAMCSLVGSGSYGFGQKRLGTSRMMRLGMTIAALGCGVLFIGSSLPLATIGLGLMGTGLGMAGTAVYALAMEAIGARGNSGAATGMVSVAIYLPQVAFPVAASALGASLGPPVVYGLMAALFLVGVAVVSMRRAGG